MAELVHGYLWKPKDECKNLRDRIIYCYQSGAPRGPDQKHKTQADADNDLCTWVDAYFPRDGQGGKWNQWSVIREAYRVRRGQAFA